MTTRREIARHSTVVPLMGEINASGSSKELYVVYAAVPEPGMLALSAIGWRLRRRTR